MSGIAKVSGSFVARIWLESGPDGSPEWRGHIRHVQGEEETYFQDMEKMTEFLGRVSGVAGPRLTAQSLKEAKKLQPGTGTIIRRKD